ncbi:MAG TPA: peptidylprolyl isomerase [Phycisphaerae bacterium]|nr:peptidylprolyl isomerase [Phycisphaerae bacterium]HNU44908.1 peptidylprolyl isomerase [Phycisphaerae bacterium]
MRLPIGGAILAGCGIWWLLGGGAGCCPVCEETQALVAIATTSTPRLFEQGEATLMAKAGGGVPPYVFRWDQSGGEEALALNNMTGDSVTTGVITAPGLYVIRLVVTDSVGTRAVEFVTLEVKSAVIAEAPRLVVVGEPAELLATSEIEDLALLWEVTKGTATIDDPTSANPMLTAALGETIDVVLTATLPGSAATATRDLEIVAAESRTPRVSVETTKGTFVIELDAERAPLTSANLLAYVDDGFYEGVLVHRIVIAENAEGEPEPFVIQMGGYIRQDGEIVATKPTRPPVPSEADNGLSNGTLYSVAMALLPDDPDSGDTQFFINLNEQNDFLDAQGFTAFGQVVEGVDVLEAMLKVELTADANLGSEVSLPVDDIVIERAIRVVSP